MSAFYDETGAIQQVEPKVEWYRAASDAGLSLPQWLNQQYPVKAGEASAYHQILASEGIYLRPDKKNGIRSTRMDAMMDGVHIQAGAITKTSDFASAALRTLFPSAILTAIEDKLVADLNVDADAFDSMVAVDDTIQGDKFERPLINFDGPSASRSRAIAQLAEPISMLTITTSSVSRTIPTLSIGLTISSQAKAATTLDLVALAVARQVAVERKLQAQEYFLSMLNGDTDVGQASLSSLGYSVTAVSLDAAASAGVTQLAWMKFLYRNSTTRKIDTIVTDLAGAMALENRTGKPTVYTDNPNSPRIDSLLTVANPSWNSSVRVFLNTDSNWPTKTLMGFDSRYAIHRVSSSTIAYTAIENFVLRRAETIRLDHGQICTRLYDAAFDTLTYS